MLANLLKIKTNTLFTKVFRPFSMRLQIELRCILFPLIILEMFLQLDWSPAVVKVHTCPYKVPQLTAHVRAKTKP
jgi:hypothetical protein